MGICGSRTDRRWGGGGGRRPVLSSGAEMRGVLSGADGGGGDRRGGWIACAEVVRTSRSCSGVRLEARGSGAARRDARRRS